MTTDMAIDVDIAAYMFKLCVNFILVPIRILIRLIHLHLHVHSYFTLTVRLCILPPIRILNIHLYL